MQLLELTIDDSSPLIDYSPLLVSPSIPDLSNGWYSYYTSSGFASSLGQVGKGESSHVTSMDGAYFSLKWNGNGIRLLGNTTLSSYSVTLDGADFTPNTSSTNRTLVDIYNLQDGDHTITLIARMPQNQVPRNSSRLVFDDAVIRTYAHGATSNSPVKQKILDGSRLSFNGRWSSQSTAPGLTFQTSNTAGDYVNATFDGTAFVLRGMTTPKAGNYTIALDGVKSTFCAQSLFSVPNTTLFFATGLDDSVRHSIEVTNNGGELSLLEDGFATFVALSGPPSSLSAASTAPSDTSLPGGTIASFALAGILFAIISTVFLFYCFIWRKRKRKPAKWDDQRYVVYNRSPANGGSLKSSWRFGRRSRTSDDIASYVAKGETMTLDIGPDVFREGKKSPPSSRNGFSIWQREALEGNTLGISLPIVFKHAGSERAEVESSELKHPYSAYNPRSPHLDRSAETKESSSSILDLDIQSVALTNLKNKGKARQITGATSMLEEIPLESERHLSCSPNLLQGLHMKVSNTKPWSIIKSPQGSVSLSLNPSTSPARGQSGPHHRNSNHDRLSSFQAASNPSFRGWPKPLSPSRRSPDSTIAPSLPSFPRSVSDSNSNTITPQNRRSSRRYYLNGHTENPEKEDHLEDHEPLPPPPHAYRNQGSWSDSNLRQSIPNTLSQVVRSLSPRVSGIGPDNTRSAHPGIEYFYAETLSEEQAALEDGQLMAIEAPSTFTSGDPPSSAQVARNGLHSTTPLLFPLGPAPSETRNDEHAQGNVVGPRQAEPDGTKLGSILPSLKRTSPFNVKFDWQSERESMAHNSKQNDSSRLRVPHFDSRDDFVQGTSRSRFRLTPSTMNHPANMVSYAPSQMSTEVVTSFLDFTNSSEVSSVRTNSLSYRSGSRIFGDSTQLGPAGSRGGRMAQLRSRWSDTTASTRPRDSLSREGNTSSSADRSSRRKTYHTSTIPPSVYVTPDTPPRYSVQRESDSTQFSTENPLHIHPSISDLESRADSLPSHHMTPDTLFRTSSSDESGNSRRTTDSSNQFHTRLFLASRYPPLPEGTNSEEASTNSVSFPSNLPTDT